APAPVPAPITDPQAGLGVTPAPAPIEPAAVASATGDLWSGFRTGAEGAGAMFSEPSTGPSAPALAFGIVFVVAGVGLLAGGVVLVTASRRRARAEA
ncbi:MAG: hypothetical protein ACRD1K_19595, partial [Acidimicrobiales bacterium]